MFVKNDRRFNINAVVNSIFIDDNGIQHPGRLLKDAEFRELHGIFEIPDPIRGNDETQFTQEIDVEPWVVIVDKAPEQIEQAIQHKLTVGVQAYLDSQAQEKGYDSILSACSYASYSNIFQQEAISFLEWRSNVWAYAYQVIDDIKSETRTIPTIEQLLAELPVRNIP